MATLTEKNNDIEKQLEKEKQNNAELQNIIINEEFQKYKEQKNTKFKFDSSCDLFSSPNSTFINCICFNFIDSFDSEKCFCWRFEK